MLTIPFPLCPYLLQRERTWCTDLSKYSWLWVLLTFNLFSALTTNAASETVTPVLNSFKSSPSVRRFTSLLVYYFIISSLMCQILPIQMTDIYKYAMPIQFPALQPIVPSFWNAFPTSQTPISHLMTFLHDTIFSNAHPLHYPHSAHSQDPAPRANCFSHCTSNSTFHMFHLYPKLTVTFTPPSLCSAPWRQVLHLSFNK